MVSKKYFLLLLISTVAILNSYSQNNDGSMLLKDILKKIESRHQITFNYIEEEIAIFKIIPPQENLTLRQKLDYISEQTQLEFRFVAANYISIINNKKLDKPLCGYLVDALTLLPVESATITITHLNQSVISNEKGFFELSVVSADNIEITHVNYEKITLSPIDLYKENCPTFKLKPVEYQLEEVITPLYLTKGISKRTDGSLEIKPKKFGLLPGLTEADVFQTMLQLPGIMSTDETISNISIRGGTHDQNLFLWNGIRLFQTGHFYGLISVLNPNMAQKISINKNGSSAFLGESVSGTVAITTNSETDTNATSIGVNMINLDFNTTLKTSKKSRLELAGRRSFTDVWTSPTYKSYLNRVFQNTVVTNLSDNENSKYETDENFYFYDATLKFHQKIKEKTNLIFNFITISNQLDLNQSKSENNETIRRKSLLDQNTVAGSIEFNTVWNANNSTEIIGYGSFYEVDSENQAIEGNQIFNQENSILDTNIYIKNTHRLTNRITFRNGYQFDEIGIRNFDRVNSPLFSRNIKDVLQIHALMAEIGYTSINTKLNTTLGFRQNYISQLGKFISEPRLQLNYAFSSYFQAEVLGEMKSQNSTQIVDLQQDFLGIEKRRWVLSNEDDVPILRSNQLSLGLTFKKNNWLITVDNFYKKVSGVASRSQNFQNQLELLKINGEYRILGTEILVQKQISDFIGWLSYAFTDNDYIFSDFSEHSFPNNFENKHQLSTGIIYNYKQLKTALGTRWFTGKPTTLPLNNTIENNQIVYEAPNSSRLSDYFQVNFSSAYTVELKGKGKLQLGASVQNVFNTKNIINQYFRINQNTSAIEKVNTYSLKFTPNAFVRFSF